MISKHGRADRSLALLSATALAAVGLLAIAPTAQAAATGTATVPRPDHVVIVVEENHSQTNIIGNPDAPYMNSLASQNANFTQFYAETHPSQPNYVAMFSGSTNGVTDDSCPIALTGPNLGNGLSSAGLSFAGYSEDLPSVGYAGCYAGKYARKHSPWADYASLPGSVNQPFSAFPTDYNQLPAVSFVIPNLDNDLHDGSVAQGDSWLQSHLSGYVDWAKTHNSLFVLTFDEDDNHAGNLIPTVLAGQRVVPGSYSTTRNHYSLLRTIQDAFGLAPTGAASTTDPILDIWSAPANDAPPTAAFSSSCTGLTCSFDGTGSSDPDGSIASYNWTFSDGGSASGSSPQHTFSTGGTFDARLSVADDLGATNSVTHSVTVTAPAGTPFLSDTFGRTVNAGWGTPDIGGPWAITGAASDFWVAGGTGKQRFPSASSSRTVNSTGVNSDDTDLQTTVAADKTSTSNGMYLTFTGRRVSNGNEYRARSRITATNTVTLSLSRLVGNTEVSLTSEKTIPGITYAANLALTARVQVIGTNPTTLRAKIWPATGTEPAAWQWSVTDSTPALQAAGGIGLTGYLSGGSTNAPEVLTFSNVSARHTATSNQPPVAAFSSACTNLHCSFDAAASTDPEGGALSYAWSFGDGGTTTGVAPAHDYAVGGPVTATLTVTDPAGASASIAHQVTPSAPPSNTPPSAVFTSSCTQLTCSFDASASSDPDGPITYSWDFGDGGTATGVNPGHDYAAGGTYNVVLTVTDSDSATGTVNHSVSVTGPPPPNQPPTAAFSTSCSGLSCSFNGTGSSDPDGTIVSYGWTFGDGTTASGSTTSHSYPAGGDFTVTLLVTDDGGATGSVTKTVSVTAPSPVFAADNFGRTVSNGWGNADVGGRWTATGAAAGFSVAGGSGALRLANAGAQLTSSLLDTTSSDTDLRLTFSSDKVANGNGVYLTVTGRRVSANNEYRARLLLNSNGTVTMFLSRLVNGTETNLTAAKVISGLDYSAGAQIALRLQVRGAGTTTVSARAWLAGSAEPAGWQQTATDTTASLQAAGAIAITAYLSGSSTSAPVTVRISGLSAKPVE